MTERILGALLASVLVVPAVALIWMALNLEVAHIGHFFAGEYFIITAAASIVFGFAFPKLLPDLIGKLWQLLYQYGRWW